MSTCSLFPCHTIITFITCFIAYLQFTLAIFVNFGTKLAFDIRQNKRGGNTMYKTDKEAADFRREYHEDHYSLAYRLSNRKLTSIAGIAFQGRTCLRAAEIAFQKAGYNTSGNYHVRFTKNLQDQKNYVGKAPLYKEL
jgi:hypothetical protein